LIERESQFDPKAESGAGAVGLAQLMPVHHKAVNPRDPIDSVRYSADYLTKLRGRFGGWDKTLAAYNYGPANVAKAVQTRGSEWKGALPAETAAYIAALTKGLK
jgi:soluble lytic murein transglycosylase-like protein